ncbi:non-ribosomal peptide synthetase [Streptomyces sp. NRRL S-495]|uniref:non-ribosomal peptide synthetase n=1 Tax=Streptomyces sp. NRRL S-495 TaxID=1609133 RepID=UPI00099D4D06|nr:non-ribosomal peptide synthetase [Streptomyces sp. NRRL S-495]
MRDDSGPAETGANRKEHAQWLLHRLTSGRSGSNIPIAFRVPGALDPKALREAVEALIARHAALRTVFFEEAGELRRSESPPGRTTVGATPLAFDEDTLDQVLAEFATEAFDLTRGPLLRVGHGRSPSGFSVVCLVAHHIVFDGVSAGILLSELTDLYDRFTTPGADAAEPPEESPRFTDPEPERADLDHWLDRLRAVDPAGMRLTTAGDPDAELFAGGRVDHTLGPEAVAAVRTLGRTLRAPDSTVLLAAYYLLLHRHGAAADLVVGVPTDSRRGPARDRAVGFHVNTLPVRIGIEPELGFGHLATRTRDAFLTGLRHSGASSEWILPELGLTHSDWSAPLFRHMFSFLPTASSERTVGGLPIVPIEVRTGLSRLDLELTVRAGAEGFGTTLVFRRQAHTEAGARALLERYERLLVAAAADVLAPLDRLPIAPAWELGAVAAANDTARTDSGPDTVLGAVLRQIALTPEAVAVQDGAEQVRYAELGSWATGLRELLAGAGVRAGDVVALALPRGARLAAAVLACWSLGAAYLPVDAAQPAARLEGQLREAAPRVLLAEPGGTDLPVPPGCRVLRPEDGADRADRTDLPEPCAPADRCYLIFTSGSTGRPKAVEVSHANLANLVRDFAGRVLGPGATALWSTTFTFDISALELFVPLASGGRVVVAPPRAQHDPEALLALVEEHAVGVVQATPTAWRRILPLAGDRLAGRVLISGGEPLPASLARELTARGGRVLNAYGPTEVTIWATVAEVGDTDGGTVSIGTPLANTVARVADAHGEELPLGCAGELWLGGAQVATGYLDRPELTAERFVRHPVDGRMYRTGDLARRERDGSLVLLGRTDRQIKLRGHRIELGEVEAVVEALPGVEAAAAVLDGDPSADGLIAVYVRTADPQGIADRIWAFARENLPPYALPGRISVVEEFPETANGKVDHKALATVAHRAVPPAPGGAPADGAESTDGAESAAGAGPVDELVRLWREVLGDDRLDAASNFFLNGGNSLTAAMLILDIRDTFDVELPLDVIFEAATPNELAEALSAYRATA